jgi:hypothetical protein
MLSRTRLLVGSSLVAAACAAAAGTVDVSFVNAGNYWDSGTSIWDQSDNLKMLATHLQKLGQHWLPPGQVLKVEVLQVDLAGTVRPLRGRNAVRVITGNADSPKMQVRYVLQAGGITLASGEEWVTDLDYTHGMVNPYHSESLYYEKRMLDKWFKKRFVDSQAAPG